MRLGFALKRMASWAAPKSIVVRGRSEFPYAVGVTFDDGPHAENTPRILDSLDEKGAHATFFMQGDAAEKNSALVREVIDRGHQIANHGYAHTDAKVVSARMYVADVMRCQAVLEDIAGSALPRDFRPPYGSVALASTIALLRRDFRFVFWSLDSCDSFLPDAELIVEHVTAQEISAGSILLFHDDYAHTVAALPRVLGHLRDRAFEIASLDSLLSCRERQVSGRTV